MIVLLNEYVKAFDAFTLEPIPGAAKANTDTMTLTIALGGGQFATTRLRACNFLVRVADDAPDDVKRANPRFVNPLFAPPPEA